MAKINFYRVYEVDVPGEHILQAFDEVSAGRPGERIRLGDVVQQLERNGCLTGAAELKTDLYDMEGLWYCLNYDRTDLKQNIESLQRREKQSE